MRVATLNVEPRAASDLGPLTTAFAAPSTCDMGKEYLITGPHNNYWQLGPAETDTACLPDDWVLGGYYRPGVCPEDYTPACVGTDFNDIGTTTCCPDHGEYVCAKSHPPSRDESIFGCSSSFEYVTTRTADDRATTATGGIMWAHSVQVRNSGPVSTATSSSPSSSPPSSGLGGGAIAGVVVGAIAGGALLAVGAFLLWRRRRSQHRATPVQQQDSEIEKETPNSSGPSELGITAWNRRHELENRPSLGVPSSSSSPATNSSSAKAQPWRPPQELHG